MGTRRTARETAVQFLFMHDFHPDTDYAQMLRPFWDCISADPEVRSFAENIIRGVISRKTELDEIITRYVQNWDFSRIALIERNILRISFYEILYRPDIPDVASINEAVDIAKKYGAQDAGKFVNGILDKVKDCEEKRYSPKEGKEP